MGLAEASVLRDDDLSAPTLGVVKSACGHSWQDRLSPARINRAVAIAQTHQLPELLGRILAARDVQVDQAAAWLDPTLKNLMPDPFSLAGMEAGAARIADAIEKGEKIAVFGDYDVDGAVSSALMSRFLAAHGQAARIYIPDRIFEGYGPNRAAIESLIEEGAGLIVTVDCGSTSHDALAVAGEKGVDVIVVDHHQVDDDLPDVHSVINPNRQDDLSGQGHLAAAGVVFMLLIAVLKTLRARGHYGAERPEPDLLQMLDMVALATICDVVPLKGLNRAYVRKGLQVMRLRHNLGLRALADVAGLKSAPDTYHLGFILGPRINAGGRIGNAALGAELLGCSDQTRVLDIAETLDRLNGERRQMELQAMEEAQAQAGQLIDSRPDLPVIILGSPDWHKGLVGLMASRLSKSFARPALVISWTDKGEGTGSARSIAGVDIGGAVRGAVADNLALKGGGHAMAAGVTIEKDKYDAFHGYLIKELGRQSAGLPTQSTLKIDGALTARGATDELMTLIEKAGPYGQGNPQPRFVFPAHRVSYAKVVGNGHVRCSLTAGDGSRLDAIAFGAGDTELGALLQDSSGFPVHFAGSLKRDNWGGRARIELHIQDAADPRKQR